MKNRFKKINIGKRAQIGATLTWFVAFLVIFFIMLLFLGATAIVTAKKKLPIISWFAGTGKDKIELVEQYSGNLRMQNNLIFFLNMPAEADNKIMMKDLILESKNTELEKEFNNFVDKLEPEPECYIIKIEREGKDDFGVYNVWDVPVVGGQRRGKPQVESVLKRTIQIYLISDQDEIIKISFYAGECKL